MNFPSQLHKKPLSELAKKYNRSIKTMERWAKETGLSKTRQQYEKDARIRRETAYQLRQQGLKFKDIAKQLNISMNNAQQLVRRYEETIK